ncbi:hypothetical protein RQP46_011313 [Phenoliferia psychrophenolica]
MSKAAGKQKEKQPSVAAFFSPPTRTSAAAGTSRSADNNSKPATDAARKPSKRTGKDAEVSTKKKRKIDVLVLSDSDDDATPSAPTASTSALPIPSPSPTPTKPPPDTKPTLPSASPSKGLAFFPGLSGSTPASTTSSRPPKSLNCSIFTFTPTTDVETSHWPKGRVPFAVLTDAFVEISATKSRLIILRVLTNLLRLVIELDPQSLPDVVYLVANKLGPAYARDLELGIGPMVLNSAIKKVSGITPASLRSLSHKHGDAGDVAFEASKSVRVLMRPPPLVCYSLFATLHKLARQKGTGSIAVKTGEVQRLLVAAQGEEVRFLVRILIQNLRVGAVGLTLTTALARAFCLSRPPSRVAAENEAYFIEVSNRTKIAEVDERKMSGKGKGKDKDDPDVRELEERMGRAEVLLRKTWASHPNYGDLIESLLSGGLDDIDSRVPLAIGTPLQPMLGTPTRSLAEVYTRLSSRPFVSEAKLDGQRGQIHVSTVAPDGDGGRGQWYDPGDGNGPRIWVRMFSKHLEDQTDKYPDLLPTLHALVQRESTPDRAMTSFIIDAEITAIDPLTGAIRTFQELSGRAKKDVALGAVKVRVGVFCFDLMYLNGVSLLAQPFRARRELLHQHFGCLQPADPHWAKLDLVPSCEDNDPAEVQAFFKQCLGMKAEGIMVKVRRYLSQLCRTPLKCYLLQLLDEAEVDSEAEEEEEQEEFKESPSKAKAKPRRNTKVLPSTLDLIPIGAWHGNGRKASWWSPILLACVDEENGTITAVSKIMSGFSDVFYQQLYNRFPTGGENTSTRPYPGVDAGGLTPHIWFNPSEVWEIKAADFTLSPVYPAAQGIVSERGISLRFPRFIKIRDDKKPEEATTSQQLADMYENQGEYREPRGGGDAVEAGDD